MFGCNNGIEVWGKVHVQYSTLPHLLYTIIGTEPHGMTFFPATAVAQTRNRN